MVIRKSTELSKKWEGYVSVASKFDEKICQLNNERKEIKKGIEKNIKRKEKIISGIRVIIEELEKENQEEYKEKINILLEIKRNYEEDISDYKKMDNQEIETISSILATRGVEGIYQEISMRE